MTEAETPTEFPHQATAYLARLDADWKRHIADIGPCQLRLRQASEPYEALVRAIAYQQLHAKAGDAILARLLALYPNAAFPSPEQLLATEPAQQRACGFSAAKLAAVRGIAQAALDGVIPTHAQALALPDEALIERLTVLRGVGRWTVEMLLIFSLGRPDVLPVDDHGVREGYRRLKGWATAPTPRQLAEIGQPWRPYRTVAAWYLWRVPKG